MTDPDSVGIVSIVVALGLYVPPVGLAFDVLSVFGLELWYILVGLRLYRLAARPMAPGAGRRQLA